MRSAKQNRRTARALFAQIKLNGYAGGYTRVMDFIRAWRSDAGKGVTAFVPLRFDLGEAFQFDWSEEGLMVGGVYHRGIDPIYFGVLFIINNSIGLITPPVGYGA